MYYTQTKLYYDIIFWPIGILRGNDVTIVLALNRISALIDLKFRNALRCAYFGRLFSVMRSFTDICERAGVRGILEFLMKRYKLCTNWRLELMQTNLLPFGCFRKSLIAHSTQLVFQCQMYNGWLLTLCSILPVPILYSDRKYMLS